MVASVQGLLLVGSENQRPNPGWLYTKWHLSPCWMCMCGESLSHAGGVAWIFLPSSGRSLWAAIPGGSQYLHQFKGEALVEDAVDAGTTRQFQRIHLVPRALDPLLKVHPKLLNHPVGRHHLLFSGHARASGPHTHFLVLSAPGPQGVTSTFSSWVLEG